MHQLFSLRGRISRLAYWKLSLLLSAVNAALFIAGTFVAMVAGWLAAPFFVLIPALVAGYISLHVRRLHDRNRSGWWLLLFFSPAALSSLLLETLYGLVSPAVLIALVGLYLFGIGLWIWGVIEIGFRAGKRGENRFGPEGVAPASGWLGRYLGSA